MADAGVSGVVTADVIEEFSNDVVLTTQWMDGEAPARSAAAAAIAAAAAAAAGV